MYHEEEKITSWGFVTNIEARPPISGGSFWTVIGRVHVSHDFQTGLVAVQNLLTSPSEVNISRGELAGKQ